jgi:NADH-quinone oxidoreductase subunit H
LAEYSNIILMSSIIVILFLGGWLSPFHIYLNFLDGGFIFSLKLLFIMFFFIWIRATLPRYRYDQLMNLGWKVILPFSLGFTLLSIFLVLLFI